MTYYKILSNTSLCIDNYIINSDISIKYLLKLFFVDK